MHYPLLTLMTCSSWLEDTLKVKNCLMTSRIESVFTPSTVPSVSVVVIDMLGAGGGGGGGAKVGMG